MAVVSTCSFILTVYLQKKDQRQSTIASDTVIANQGALELQPPVVIVTPSPSQDASEEVEEEMIQEQEQGVISVYVHCLCLCVNLDKSRLSELGI